VWSTDVCKVPPRNIYCGGGGGLNFLLNGYALFQRWTCFLLKLTASVDCYLFFGLIKSFVHCLTRSLFICFPTGFIISSPID